jgi:hypothetical protein
MVMRSQQAWSEIHTKRHLDAYLEDKERCCDAHATQNDYKNLHVIVKMGRTACTVS